MTATVTYLGDLATRCIHESSGYSMTTDAPVDNHGRGASFSPTDCIATSLASCLLTIMGIRCRENNWSMRDTCAEVAKTMASHPRRIAQIDVKITMKGDVPIDQRKGIERLALGCPVAKSLHPDIAQNIEFNWD